MGEIGTTEPVNRLLHQLIHGKGFGGQRFIKGGQWNTAWYQWLKNNPDKGIAEAFEYLDWLRVLAGI